MLNQLLLQHGLLFLHHMHNVEKIFLHIHPVALPILNTKEKISVLKHKLKVSLWLKIKIYFPKISNRDKHKTVNNIMSKYKNYNNQNIVLHCGITHKINCIKSKYIIFYSSVERISPLLILNCDWNHMQFESILRLGDLSQCVHVLSENLWKFSRTFKEYL